MSHMNGGAVDGLNEAATSPHQGDTDGTLCEQHHAGDPPPTTSTTCVQPAEGPSAASPVVEAKPLSYEELSAQYEEHKRKTKAWQEMIRQRDTAMRQQLKRSTEQLLERDKEVAALTRQVQEQELIVAEAKHHEAVRFEKTIMEEQMSRLQGELRDSQGEVAELQKRVDASRARIRELEQHSRVCEWRSGPLHVLYGPEPPPQLERSVPGNAAKPEGRPSDSSHRADAEASHVEQCAGAGSPISLQVLPTVRAIQRVRIHSTNGDPAGKFKATLPSHFTLCIDTASGSWGWLNDEVLAGSGLELPKCDADLFQEVLQQAEAAAASAEAAKAEQHAEQVIASLHAKFDAKAREAAASAEEVVQLQQLQSALREQWMREKSEELSRMRQEAAVARDAEVSAAVDEERRMREHVERGLRDKVRELEEYRTRAQAAMKKTRAMDTRDMDSSMEMSHLKAELEGVREQLRRSTEKCAAVEARALELESTLVKEAQRLKECQERMEVQRNMQQRQLQLAHAESAEERAMHLAEIESLRASLAKVRLEHRAMAHEESPPRPPQSQLSCSEARTPTGETDSSLLPALTPGSGTAATLAMHATPPERGSEPPKAHLSLSSSGCNTAKDIADLVADVSRTEWPSAPSAVVSTPATNRTEATQPAASEVNVRPAHGLRSWGKPQNGIPFSGDVARDVDSTQLETGSLKQLQDEQYSFATILRCHEGDIAHSSLTEIGSGSVEAVGGDHRLREEVRRKDIVISRLQEELRRLVLEQQACEALTEALRQELNDIKSSQAFAEIYTSNPGYVKNIILKYLACTDKRIRKSLVPVLAQVLHLTDAEKEQCLHSL